MKCAELEDLAAELALGTVSGTERGLAVEHLAGCGRCRELVEQLARAADGVLSLAPVVEPPPGFESRVLSRMVVESGRVRRPPRHRRVLTAIAAVAVVAGLSAAGAAWLAQDGPQGEIRTALVRDEQGRWSCRAVVYGEDPTWLVVSLDRADGSNAAFSVEAVHGRSSMPVPVGTLALQNGHGSLAKALELPAEDVRSVRVLDPGGRVRYEVTLPS